MFTVKTIDAHGDEHLYPDVKSVSYTIGEPENSAGGPKRANVTFTFADESGRSRITIEAGEVYVMNEAGRTVSKYVLKTKEFPHGLAPRQAAA